MHRIDVLLTCFRQHVLPDPRDKDIELDSGNSLSLRHEHDHAPCPCPRCACNAVASTRLSLQHGVSAMTNVLGLVVARGGSKRTPRKNLAQVAGKPLLAWTIEVALESERISRLILSTEDDEVAKAGQEWGAERPFVRPRELARDETPAGDVLLHALQWLDSEEGYRPDYAMLLQPTSPLRSPLDIQTSIDLAIDRQAESVVSVVRVELNPDWMMTLSPDGRLEGFRPPTARRSHDVPQLYALNGAIYLVEPRVFRETRTLFTPRTYAYIMPTERSLDVDTPWDLHLAELILRNRVTHGRH